MGSILLVGEEVTTTVPDFSSLISTLTNAITPAQLLIVLGSVIGAGMAFVLMWFGVRKLIKIFTNALQRGKLRV